jgi:hypothetical protein
MRPLQLEAVRPFLESQCYSCASTGYLYSSAQIFVGVLRTMDKDPLANLVSPCLTATTGVIPLSIISVIPDIIRHYADVILTAEKEVFLATSACCSWVCSQRF